MPKDIMNIVSLHELAIEQGITVLGLIPEEFRTEDLCLKALKKSCRNMQAIPKALFSTLITREYILEYPEVLQYLPRDYPEYDEICLECVKKYYGNATFISFQVFIDKTAIKTLNEIKGILEENIDLTNYSDELIFQRFGLKFKNLKNKSMPYNNEIQALISRLNNDMSNYTPYSCDIPSFINTLLLDDTVYEGMTIHELACIFPVEKMGSIFEQNGNFKYLCSQIRLTLLKACVNIHLKFARVNEPATVKDPRKYY